MLCKLTLRRQAGILLCSSVSLVAVIASAQERPAAISDTAGLASGWWSPHGAGAAPQLQISRAELTRFDESDSIGTSSAQPTGDRVAEAMDSSIASLQYFDPALGPRTTTPSLWVDLISPPTKSSLSLLEKRYATWEASLSDSRSLIDVNGVSVYPLFQVDYVGWHLPVTLYISPLR
jgi:hypothetical protein